MKIEPADVFSLDVRDSARDYPPIVTIEMNLEPQHQPFPPRAMRSRSSSTVALRCSQTPPPDIHPYYGPTAPLSRAAQASIRASPLSVQLQTNGDEPGVGSSSSHTKLKRYMCDVCGKKFDRPSILQTHMNIHTKAQPYSCGLPGCGALFNTKSNATRHRRTHDYAESGETGPLEPPPAKYPKPVRFVEPITYSSGSSSAYPISSSLPLRQYMNSS
ncbi:hypothetical protein FB451DRAFT_1231362 [Mycena latifolia]|nr:hypothetical protein FB451DRAFT_1231362 [Mycena latifolia]